MNVLVFALTTAKIDPLVRPVCKYSDSMNIERNIIGVSAGAKFNKKCVAKS